jgi:hypothetical protein
MGKTTERSRTVSLIVRDGRSALYDLEWRQLSDGIIPSLAQAEAFAEAHIGTTTIEECPGGFVVYAVRAD